MHHSQRRRHRDQPGNQPTEHLSFLQSAIVSIETGIIIYFASSLAFQASTYMLSPVIAAHLKFELGGCCFFANFFIYYKFLSDHVWHVDLGLVTRRPKSAYRAT